MEKQDILFRESKEFRLQRLNLKYKYKKILKHFGNINSKVMILGLEPVMKHYESDSEVCFMFEDLNLSPAKKEIFEAIRKNFPELEEKYKNLSKEFWLEKEKEIKTLGKKYKKPVEIYFKHTGSLKFR